MQTRNTRNRPLFRLRRGAVRRSLSLLLAALLLVLTALPALAATVYRDGYGINYTVEETGGERVFTGLTFYYYRGCPAAYLPKELDGVPLTTENVSGENLYDYAAPFAVDEDNAYFAVRDGMLYTKDLSTLVSCPWQFVYSWSQDGASYYDNGGIFYVPEGTQRLGRYCLNVWYGVCVVIPDSVTFLDEDCGIYEETAIAANPGGAAEAWALAHGVTFIPLGETHAHVWFRTVTAVTCTTDGRTAVSCPCGAIRYEETTPADPAAHRYVWCPVGPNGEDKKVCEVCCREMEDGEAADCPCGCHTIEKDLAGLARGGAASLLKGLTYRIRLLFWRLTGTHQYCECGARHY